MEDYKEHKSPEELEALALEFAKKFNGLLIYETMYIIKYMEQKINLNSITYFQAYP